MGDEKRPANGGAMMDVFTIIEKEEFDKTFWVKIGAAFPNRDGTFTIFLDALPLNGKLHVRPRNMNLNPNKE